MISGSASSALTDLNDPIISSTFRRMHSLSISDLHGFLDVVYARGIYPNTVRPIKVLEFFVEGKSHMAKAVYPDGYTVEYALSHITSATPHQAWVWVALLWCLLLFTIRSRTMRWTMPRTRTRTRTRARQQTL